MKTNIRIGLVVLLLAVLLSVMFIPAGEGERREGAMVAFLAIAATWGILEYTVKMYKNGQL